MSQPRKKYRFIPRARGTSARQQHEWRQRHRRPIDIEDEREHIMAYIDAIQAKAEFSGEVYNKIVQRMARAGHPQYSKANLRRGYLMLGDAELVEIDAQTLQRLTLKPTRTLSGVAPVTVLTKPYPCPGQCIFCPTDVRMPKSYLSNEPGAMRALMLEFDPFVQVKQRIKAMERIGHTTDKVELLILGGTWSSYPVDYQEWFVRRCFDALNGVEAKDIEEAQQINEKAEYRNVGLVIETRPDHITVDEVRRLRQLGVTRVQLGVQALSDDILDLNKRGHGVEAVREAMRLLRGTGFKIALHWMPNLLGATPESDLMDFKQLWSDPTLQPDELKIYPTGLLRGTELYDHYAQGAYRPYSRNELLNLLIEAKKLVPEYCRLNRVMRDIPAPEIAAGVTQSNLRQMVQQKMQQEGTPCQCIRCREVRAGQVDPATIQIKTMRYQTDHSEEVFISAVTLEGKLAGFLRLSLPGAPPPLSELHGQAIIRQVQVYGPMVGLDDDAAGRAQHQGLGGRLIAAARMIARDAGFEHWAVIAAAGTRDYYRRYSFELGKLYMSGET